MVEKAKKGGEVDSRWTGVPESDPDQSWGRTRDALRSGELRRARKPKVTSETDQPGNPASVKPWNKNMVRPIDKTGRYRIVDAQGKVHPLPSKPR